MGDPIEVVDPAHIRRVEVIRPDIPSLETIDIMSHLVAGYEITAADGMSIMQAMAEADRALRLPARISDLGG